MSSVTQTLQAISGHTVKVGFTDDLVLLDAMGVQKGQVQLIAFTPQMAASFVFHIVQQLVKSVEVDWTVVLADAILADIEERGSWPSYLAGYLVGALARAEEGLDGE
jgi:hypothetical protein